MAGCANLAGLPSSWAYYIQTSASTELAAGSTVNGGAGSSNGLVMKYQINKSNKQRRDWTVIILIYTNIVLLISVVYWWFQWYTK